MQKQRQSCRPATHGSISILLYVFQILFNIILILKITTFSHYWSLLLSEIDNSDSRTQKIQKDGAEKIVARAQASPPLPLFPPMKNSRSWRWCLQHAWSICEQKLRLRKKKRGGTASSPQPSPQFTPVTYHVDLRNGISKHYNGRNKHHYQVFRIF